MVPPAAGEDDDLDDLPDDVPPSPPSGSRPTGPTRRPPAPRSAPVRRWRRSSESEDWDDDLDEPAPLRGRARHPVFWRARDSLYFEPLVALAIIAVLLVSLFAYTSNWPPVYVVESNSMQHGSGDHLGVLNAGDIVLAQKVGQGSIVPYVQALATGYSTYGRYGDVILYYPNGTTSVTPIIHRAIIYLQYDPGTGHYNATGLAGDLCGNDTGAIYSTTNTKSDCGTTNLGEANTLTLYHVGKWNGIINFGVLQTTTSDHSGYLTLGDNNTLPDQLTSVIPLSSLVEPSWVIGVARGLIPWFGALKLLLDGNSGKVPGASWEFMGLTVAGVIFAAAGVHLLLRRRREERGSRRDRDEDEDEDLGREEAPSRPSATRTPVRPWRASPVDDAESAEPAAPRRMSYEQRRRAHFTSAREQRPPPRRHPARKGHDRKEAKDEEDET